MKRQPGAVAAVVAAPAARRYPWLMLVHQLSAKPSNLRVRTWRRLQQLGAIAVKQAVYVLPDSENAREDFEWLRAEIEASGGEATVFRADAVDTWVNDELVDAFRKAREDDYRALESDLNRLIRAAKASRSNRRPAPQAFKKLRERLTSIERMDFFGSAGRDAVVAKLQALEAHSPASGSGKNESSSATRPKISGALWVTRPRPGVDRMASAWLIRRFIDPEARFDFVPDRRSAAGDAIPFDMFGVEYGHRGDLCTFEVLSDVFKLTDPEISRLAAIVHDLDLKDGKFGSAEASTIGTLIEGLQLHHADDHRLLDEGTKLFETLYQSFSKAARLRGPRPVAKHRGRQRA